MPAVNKLSWASAVTVACGPSNVASPIVQLVLYDSTQVLLVLEIMHYWRALPQFLRAWNCAPFAASMALLMAKSSQGVNMAWSSQQV